VCVRNHINIWQQQLKLNLNLQPTAPKVQQQHLGNRRNSSTSNASSTADNFDTFITLRNASGNTSTDYMAKQQQQQQQHRRGKQQQQQQSVPLTSALNYYGHGATPTLNPALAYNGKLTATAMLSQVNLSRAAAAAAATSSSVAAAATAAPLLPHQQHSRSTSKGEGFILEYEC